MLTYPHFEPHFPKRMWSLPLILEHQARTIGERPFLQWTDQDAALSFAAVNRRVNRLAHGFRGIGIGRGDRVVLFMPNSLDLIFAWFAANKLGAVEVPINIAYRGSFLEHQVNICRADTIVTSTELLAHVIDSLPRMPAVKRILVWSAETGAADPAPVPGYDVFALATLYAEREDDPGVAVSPRELAAILYTSGTTGLSKGVQMPQAQVYMFAELALQVAELVSEDVYMTSFPLFHANAQFVTVYPCLIAGAKCVLYERFSASEWVDRLHASGATITTSLGVTLPFAYAQPPSPRDNTHGVTRIFAAPVPHDLLEPIRARFGVQQFVTGYGMTEICIPFLKRGDIEQPKGACGLVVDQWFDVRLVDPETDEEVPTGQVGELIIRHREPWTLNAGYVNMPEATLGSYRNLWFHTGDAMRRDEEGWYYFVDRFKDALRRRGENISSFEVEEPIRTHPAVLDVAVIGVPADEAAGEDEVKACIVVRQGHSLSGGEVIDWCAARMPAFLVPRYIEFLPDLPRTPTERIQKAVLRRMEGAQIWDRVKSGYRVTGAKPEGVRPAR